MNLLLRSLHDVALYDVHQHIFHQTMNITQVADLFAITVSISERRPFLPRARAHTINVVTL